MWTCNNCSETSDNTFDTCWNCGTSRDGAVDESFQSIANLERDKEPMQRLKKKSDKRRKPLSDKQRQAIETKRRERFDRFQYRLRVGWLVACIPLSVWAYYYADWAGVGALWLVSAATSGVVSLIYAAIVWPSNLCPKCGSKGFSVPFGRAYRRNVKRSFFSGRETGEQKSVCQRCGHSEWNSYIYVKNDIDTA